MVLNVATLVANFVDWLPPAGAVGGAVGGIDEELALVAAAADGGVPLTLRNGGAGDVGGVAVRTALLAETSSVGVGPFAHGVQETVGLEDHGTTVAFALDEIGIPAAIGVSFAGRHGVVTEVASELAGFSHLVDFADREGVAVGDEGGEGGEVLALNTRACTDASGGRSIPVAVDVSQARSAIGVAIVARTHADEIEGRIREQGSRVHGVGPNAAAVSVASRSVEVLAADAFANGGDEPALPLTARVVGAGADGGLTLARDIAFSSVPVPVAVGVGIAGGDILILLTAGTLALAVHPFASSGEGPADGLVGDETAGR